MKTCMWSGIFEYIVFGRVTAVFYLEFPYSKHVHATPPGYPILLKLCVFFCLFFFLLFFFCSGIKMCMCVCVFGSIICHNITAVLHR